MNITKDISTSGETKSKKVIRVFETFAGIGAQHKAISNINGSLKTKFEITRTSEWDARAIMAYAQIHNKDKYDKELRKLETANLSKINNYFSDKVFSLNSKAPGKILSKPLDFKKRLMAANIANNNESNIMTVSGKLLSCGNDNIDLLTYSFPCQGLSIANMGRDKGIKEESNSTSNLIWQIRRILIEANNDGVPLPKYLLMENVKNLISKKHRSDYERWNIFLRELGYSTYYGEFNGFKHGSLQKRVRIFALSILDNKGIIDDNLNKLIEDHIPKNELSIEERKVKYNTILNSSKPFKDEIDDATPKQTPSRKRMATENCDLIKDAHKKEYTFNTLTTKQDRNPNIGMITVDEQKGIKRFITPREAYQIMGFESSDFDKVKPLYKDGYITKESLYRQAGNSIVVSVLEDIFRYIAKLEEEK